jgi:long-chain acyl-CoA synthetase
MSRLLDTLGTGDSTLPALACGAARLSRGGLLAQVESWSDALRGDAGPVAIALPNGISWLVADLALHMANRPAVPVPPWYGAAQLAHLAATAGISAIISSSAPAIPYGRAVALSADAGLWPLAVRPVPLPPGTAKVTFTSGTTGTPKGVCLSHAALEAVATSLAGIGRELGIRRHLCLLPLAVLLENIGGAWAALLANAECVVPPLESLGLGGASDIDETRLVHALDALAPQSLILVPGLLEAIVAAIERGAPRPASLRFVAVGGAPTPCSLLERAARLGLPVYEGYGLSECASVVTLNRPGDHQPGTVGRALPHTHVSIAPSGEILADGPMMLGYVGDAQPPGRPWATGDLGRIDGNGRLCIVGRKRNVFITAMGRNLSPEWLEAELAEAGPIRQAVVFGEGLLAPVAVLAAHASATPAVGPWIEAVNERLPGHARISRWVIADEAFTPANGLCTPNGRPLRSAIWARYGSALRDAPPTRTAAMETT